MEIYLIAVVTAITNYILVKESQLLYITFGFVQIV